MTALLAITRGFGAECELYPIALSAQSLANVSAGDFAPDIFNGTQPGNFGWLTWAGSPSVPTLVRSLTPPGDSHTFVNPDNRDDHVVSIGDWVQGKPGVSNSQTVRDALDALKSRDIIVPVWDETRGQGEKVAYQVAAFARVRVVGYQLPGQNRITARFLGYVTCGTQNQPPNVEAGADQTILLPDSTTLDGAVSDDGLPVVGTVSVTWSAVSGPGIVSFGSPQAATTTASFDVDGTYQLRLTASDGELTASDDLIVAVNRPNDPPVGEPIAIMTDEDTPVSVALHGSDPNGGALSFVVETEPSYGTLNGTPPGLTYTPKADYNGPDRFTFKAFDGSLYSAGTEVTITVRPVNDRPVADPLTASTVEDTPLPITLSGSDVEGTALAYVILSQPAHGTLTRDPTSQSAFTYTPHVNYQGEDSFTFKVNDGESDSASATVNLRVTSVNDAPAVTAGDDQTISLPTNRANLTGSVTDDYFADATPVVFWSMVSGPGTISFGDSSAPATTATFSASGVYVLRLTATDFDFTVRDDLTITVNAPPVVDAGSASPITLPELLTLNGSVTDDGLPANGAVTVAWSKVSGPGTVVFSHPQSAATTASFSESGVYVLRLTAEDTLATATDDLTVIINGAPIVDAGSDQLLTDLHLNLSATATDDKLPSNTLTLQWTQVSGTGDATFADANSAATTVNFSERGVYVLRLSVDDTLATARDDIVISINRAPVVDAGADLVVNHPAAVALSATVTDDGLPPNVTITKAWGKISGPGEVTFGDPTAATTTATFSVSGIYVLRFTADDTLLAGADELTIRVNPAAPNQPPVVNAGEDVAVRFTNRVVLNATVTDDSSPLIITWSKVSGPGAVVFADASAVNTTVTFGVGGNYILRLTVSDPEFTTTDEITAAIYPNNQPPGVNAGADQIFVLSPPVSSASLPSSRPIPAGNKDSKGTNFWVAFSGNWTHFTVSGTFSPVLTLFVAAEANTTGTVTIPGLNFLANFTVTAGSVTAIPIPQSSELFSFGKVEEKGIHITAADDVTVYGLSNSDVISDAFLALPTDALGTDHIVLAYPQGGTQFAIVGTEDETTVTINLSEDITYYPDSIPNFQSGAPVHRFAGVPFTVTLHQGQTFHLRHNGDATVDFTGTVIQSDKPVAVFGSHLCAEVPVSFGGCNYLVEQLPPVSSWGRKFVTLPLAHRTRGDIFRFLAAANGTHIHVNGALVATLDRGQVHEQFVIAPSHITADQPILVAQYSVGADHDQAPLGDPFMILVPPFEQFLPCYTVATLNSSYPANGFATNFVNILAPDTAVGSIQVDGVAVPASSFVAIGSSGFAGAQVPLTRGSHQLTGPVAFGAVVYGYDRFDGYGYVGGLALGSVASVADVTLTPPNQTHRVATEQCVVVAVTDANQQPLAGVRVDFEVTGANPTTGLAFTEGNGLARFCYVAASPGTDVIIARTGAFSATGTNVWTPLPALFLNGMVTDDGLPAGSTLAVSWAQVSGPGTASFDDVNAPATGVNFSHRGMYVLRLSGSDSEFGASDEVTITVRSNLPPVVNAGIDQVVVFPGQATLQAIVSDDGVPSVGTPSLYWNQVSGPALARIHDATAMTTAVSFDTAGTYIFRLTASDLLLTGRDEVVVVVQQPPTVRVTTPSSNTLFQEGNNISLTARANDNDGAISRMEFFVGAVKIGETTSRLSASLTSPYGVVWTNAFPGTNDLTAVATDSQGLNATSVPVRLIVNARPPIRFTNPTNALFEVVPSDLTLNVEASDPDGTVTSVVLYEVFISPEGYESPFIVDQRSAAPFTFVRPFIFPGVRKFQAWAYDDRGGVGVGEITLRIRALPQVRIEFLADGSTQGANRPLDLFATAAAYDGQLSRVEFFAETTSLGEAVLHPIFGFWWYLNWTNPPTGDFVLTAAATDSEGKTGLSQPILVHFRHAPTIQFTSPANNAVVDYGQPLLLAATAHDQDSAVALVEFYADDQKIAEANGPSNFTFSWTNAPVGTFLLTARAIDDTGLSTTSEPVQVTIRPVPTAPPLVNITRPTNNAAFYRGASIRVEAAFSDPDGYVAKVEFYANAAKLNEVVYPISPVPHPTSEGFTWFNPPLGNHTLSVVATDSSGIISTSAPVAISVLPAPPVVQITNPRDGQRFLVGGLLALQGSAYDTDGTVTNLQFFQNGQSIGSLRPFSSSFYFPLPALPKGDYTFAAVATDNSGLSTTSAPVRVKIGNYGGPPFISLSLTNEDRVITAPTPILGTVTNLFPNTYELSYRLKIPDGTGQWIPFAVGVDDVLDGPLGMFDPTLLLNGIYEVQVSAADPFSGTTMTATTTVVVEGNLKIGHFTLSFNDLTVPMAGVPIQVTRTYDSRDKRVGDFGVGWTLDLKSVRLQKNRSLSKDWIETTTGGDFPTYCLDPVKSRLVTITFPGGKVHRFRFDPNPNCQPLVPISNPRWRFTPEPGTQGTLEPASIEEPDGEFLTVNGSIPGTVDVFDLNFFTDAAGNPAITTDQLYAHPDLFRFTTPEGYRYLISETNGLQSVTDPNGNTVTITTDGLFHSAGKNVLFQRDPLGRITNIVDAAGASMRCLYDLRGDLTAFIDREGHTNTFTYDGRHNLLMLTDARGIAPARNEYDDSGRLIRHVDTFGKEINYTHDTANRQEVIEDRLGNVTVHEYDDRGNVVRTVAPDGGVTRSVYDERDNVLMQVDPLNRTNYFTYDAFDNRTSVTDPLGHTTSFTYNAQRRVTSVTDPRGHAITNVFDAKGNLLSMRDPLGRVTTFAYTSRGLPVAVTNTLGHVTRFEYDSAGNLTNEVNALGHATSYLRDAQGNLLSQSTTRTTSNGLETLTAWFQYDHLSRLTNTVFPDGTSVATIYNLIGKPAATIDQLGRRTIMEYDELGRLTRTLFPDGSLEGSAYDAEGRRTASTNRLGQVTRHDYDAAGRLFRTISPDGTTTTTFYNIAGQIVASTDARTNSTFYGYDDAGRTIAVTNALGQVTRSVYDESGNVVQSIDALGRTNFFFYDALNRRTNTVFADGSQQWTFFDELGRRVAETDQNTNTTWFGYDALGRLTSVTNALGYVTRYEYNELGQQTAQIDANQHTTTFDYDSLGRRTKRTLPGGQFENYAYNMVGLLANRTDFNGYSTAFLYDSMNRLREKRPDPRRGEPSVFSDYNALGQRTNMVDASGVTTYRYDDRNRLIEKTKTWGGTGVSPSLTSTLNYAYDASGNVTNIHSSNANGTDVTYEYDALNRLSAVDDAKLGRTAYTYDDVGNLRSYTYPNGVNSFYEYDSLNRLTNMAVSKPLTPLANYAYTVAPTGHRQTATETLTINSQPSTINRIYNYDALYRLTGESISINSQPSTLNYAYDPVGNRLSRLSTLNPIPSTSHGYDANDRLLSDTYDNNGNTLVGRQSSGALVSDRYNFENRLIERQSTLNSQPITINLAYDGDGNRVAKTVTTSTNTVTTFYVVDDLNPTGYAQVLEELTYDANDPLYSTPPVTRVYSYGTMQIAQDRFNGAAWVSSFYGYDGHGSVRYLTDELGQITDTYDYDAFGNLIGRTGSTPNNFLFTGEQFDSDLGLYYLRARYHNPDTGRFWTADSFEGFGSDPASLHKYTYCGNDPANCVDPSGNTSIGELSLATGLWGTARAIFGATIGGMTGGLAAGYDSILHGQVSNQEIARAMSRGFTEGATAGAFFGFAGGFGSVGLFGTSAIGLAYSGAGFLTAYQSYLSGNIEAGDFESALAILGTIGSAPGLARGSVTTARGLTAALESYYSGPKNFVNIRRVSASVANEGYEFPPYAGDAIEFQTSRTLYFIRLRTPKNYQTGRWLAATENVMGKTASELKQLFALEAEPTGIQVVRVPAGTRMRAGRVAAQPRWGAFGDSRAVQYQLLSEIDAENFSSTTIPINK